MGLNLFGAISGNNETVGIDIGSHSVKVVQIVHTRNGYLLKSAGSAPTPPEAVNQAVVENRPALADTIQGLLHTLGISTPLVVSAVAGPSVVVRQVQLPVMPEHQLRKSIYWEARNYLSFPVEDSLLEFQILGTRSVDGTPQMDVMLAATPRELVDSRVDTLEQAGLDPIAIELEPFALMRGLVDLPYGHAGMQETVALVDIGAAYTHITIISNGTFVLTRSVTIAGNSFTQAIASALGVEPSHAEDVKEHETRVVFDETARAQLTPVGQQASRALEPMLEELIREVRRSFAFFDYQQVPSATGSQRSSEGISRIILTGGSAKMAGLDTYLNEQLAIPVTQVDLLSSGAVLLPERADEIPSQMPLLATAFGLALREPMLAREKRGSR